MLPERVVFVFTSALALFGSSACASTIYERYAYNKEWDPRRHEYIIGPSDALTISVYRSPEMSGSGTVRPDGVITLPLLGELVVAGLTPTQVREEVKKKLAVFIKTDAIVNVTVSGINSYRFVVTGNVGRPASYQARYYVTVAEAMAMAGGPTRFADDQILILRADREGRLREIPVSYKAILSGHHPEQDLCVTTGDAIVVQ